MCEKLTVFFYPQNQKKEVNHNGKTENPRTAPSRQGTSRDAACTGTAQAGASGEQKEVSGERRETETHPPPLQSGRHDREPCPGGQRSHTHRNDRADGIHLFSVRSPASRPSHVDYSHQPSEQRKGVESRWHYFI